MTACLNLPDIPLVPLDRPTATVFVLKLREYNVFQLSIVMGDDHRWFAGIDLCHDPSNELLQHWVDCGAAQRFSEHYKIMACPDNFARNFGTPTYSA
jgi:hypothetical protein